jgi:hypothetical protein
MAARLARAVDLERFREPVFLVAVFAAACALVASRRPDALLNPQFYFEDGAVFYADAHNLGGLAALLLPYRGYFVVAQRLGALAALAVPLARAPLAFNLLAIAVEALPAVVVASRRYAHVAPRRSARLALAFLYLALPGVWGLIATLTNAQWHLAALALLVVLAAPPTGRAWRTFDVAALVLSGLSGPMCFALVPVAAVVWYVRRDRWAAVLVGLAAATACVQAGSLILRPAPNATPVPLGASAGVLARLVAQRVVYAALLGQRVSAALVATGAAASTPAIAIAAAGGLAALAYAVLRGPLELKLLVAYGAVVLGLALLWPVPTNFVENGYWAALAPPGTHSRYFYLLTLALVVAAAWMASREHRGVRALGALALAPVLLCAVPFDWVEPPYRDCRFAEYVARYERAAPGERVQIPTPPDWSMILTKR